jgi:hypothetical protein
MSVSVWPLAPLVRRSYLLMHANFPATEGSPPLPPALPTPHRIADLHVVGVTQRNHRQPDAPLSCRRMSSEVGTDNTRRRHRPWSTP